MIKGQNVEYQVNYDIIFMFENDINTSDLKDCQLVLKVYPLNKD